MTALFYVMLFLFLFTAVILCFSILIQEAKSLGLGASFGGEGGDSLFGTSTAEVLKKFTAYVSGAFLIGCFILSIWTTSLANQKEELVPMAPPNVEAAALTPDAPPSP